MIRGSRLRFAVPPRDAEPTADRPSDERRTATGDRRPATGDRRPATGDRRTAKFDVRRWNRT
jgi:hypothetical protein